MLPLLILGTCGAISAATLETAIAVTGAVGIGGGSLAYAAYQKYGDKKDSKDVPIVTEIPGGLILQFSREKS